MSDVSPAVGCTYSLTENDYRYGVGPLIVRVNRVIEPADFGEGGSVDVWWRVEAMCRHPSDTSRPGRPRDLYVRADRLSATLMKPR
jgi:hypothetical protein